MKPRKSVSRLVMYAAMLGSVLLLSSFIILPSFASNKPVEGEGVRGTLTQNRLYLPIICNEFVDFTVNPQDREASKSFFNNVYSSAVQPFAAWDGNHDLCLAGETSDAFKLAVRVRINYYRAMAGVPDIIDLVDEYNHKAQQAALMMSVNGILDHEPTSNWTCYTPDGDEAAGSSNLFLGYYGLKAIDGYMKDNGGGNYAVGHRRWVLYPQTKFMGSGDIPSTSGYAAANALWVFDSNIWGPRPTTREEYVAWPPPGYVPYQVIFPRWSFSYPGADFSAASVSMSAEGSILPCYQQPVVNGYGENTLVWEPVLNINRPPSHDTIHTVEITNVIINGAPRNFTYQVIIFDPESELGELLVEAPDTILGKPPVFP